MVDRLTTAVLSCSNSSESLTPISVVPSLGANSSLQYGEAERSVMVSGMMAIGRVTMPGRTIAGLDTSALLTGAGLHH